MLEATVLVVSVLTPRLRGNGGNRRPTAAAAAVREALDVDGRGGRLLLAVVIDDDA